MKNQTNSNPNTLIHKPKSKIQHELKPIWPKYIEKEKTLPIATL